VQESVEDPGRPKLDLQEYKKAKCLKKRKKDSEEAHATARLKLNGKGTLKKGG